MGIDEDWFDSLGIMGMNFDEEGSCTPELPCVLDRPEYATLCGTLRSNHVVNEVPGKRLDCAFFTELEFDIWVVETVHLSVFSCYPVLKMSRCVVLIACFPFQPRICL